MSIISDVLALDRALRMYSNDAEYNAIKDRVRIEASLEDAWNARSYCINNRVPMPGDLGQIMGWNFYIPFTTLPTEVFDEASG